MTRRLCVIPARGGSKRLPRKNAAEFLGRPIIAYTVDAALRADRFARVVVSTDDGEIAAAAGAAGAEVDPRPAHLAGDDAGIADVCLELLDREEAAGRTYDVLAILLATAALRTAADVRATVDLVGPGGVEFAMAVTTFGFPPHQALRDDGAGGLRALWPDLINARSSEFGQVCVDNGSTYAAAVPAYRARRGDLYAPGLRGHVMPRARSVDIDYAEDLDFARLLAQAAAP
ncbi:MAG: pseudaminic acid cytidylyltransferase [Hyphomicrobiales bacterium]|nr:pseudaminic acid cytidylyltransferase [Hyphomicrobiales bacterium]